MHEQMNQGQWKLNWRTAHDGGVNLLSRGLRRGALSFDTWVLGTPRVDPVERQGEKVPGGHDTLGMYPEEPRESIVRDVETIRGSAIRVDQLTCHRYSLQSVTSDNVIWRRLRFS